jgi:coenzyme F420-reducing hydrogenase gamma subunit/ferredoxin/aerobic-type carbon monoxide dehydrogenase small subunit (CoxS/CutS family)
MKNLKTKAMGKMVKIKVDGREIKASEGSNLVKTAKDNGIFIPSLCYYQHHEEPLGTCRVCTCSVNGRQVPACTVRIKEGMEIEVHNEELTDMRRAIVEMMFAEGNHFCPACPKSGDCDLQHMGYEMGVSVSRFPHLFKDRLIDFEPKRMIIEHNRCVKCRRCVEEVLTNDGKQVFSFCNRANETTVGIDYTQEAKLTEEQAIEAMKICPTGAILVRGQSIAQPFGNRKFDMNSVNEGKGSNGNPYSSEPPVFKDKPKKAKPKGKKVEKKIIATTSLAGCFGCHMSMLDIDLELIDIIELVDFNKSPLTDIKEFTEMCDVGLIEGGCCNSDNVEVLREFRKKCKKLVVVGECAIWGGLPAMRNTIPLVECLEEAYLNCVTTEPAENDVPYHEDLPKILDKVYPCNEIVEIDYFIPGCPPSATHIWKAVKNLLFGEEYSVLYSEFKYD